MRVVIIGAGPAGLACASQLLTKSDCKIVVLEASGTVGGLSRSELLWERKVDIGPHRFFCKNNEVDMFWRKALDFDYFRVARLTRIYHDKRFYLYPLEMFDTLRSLGVIEAFRCLVSYWKACLFPNQSEEDFEGWVINRFGQRLYLKFFKSYSEKLWGIPCSTLSANFAKQRIKKLTFSEILKRFIPVGKRNQHKTLIQEFNYPKTGAGEVYEKLASRLRTDGVQIEFLKTVSKIERLSDGSLRITCNDQTVFEADFLVSTMPIHLFLNSYSRTSSKLLERVKNLKFRNTILVYTLVNKLDVFPDQWIYLHDSEILCGRITNFNNWTDKSMGVEYERTILCLEYWANSHDKIWRSSDLDIHQIAVRDLQLMNLGVENDILEFHVKRIENSYPIYSDSYSEILQKVAEFVAEEKNIFLIGRNGAFKYNNQDHSILMGLRAADNILGAKFNLWDINDDDEYQENSEVKI